MSKKVGIPCVVWIVLLVFLAFTLVVIPVDQSKVAPVIRIDDETAILGTELNSDRDCIVDKLDLFPEIDNSIVVGLLVMVGTLVVGGVGLILDRRLTH